VADEGKLSAIIASQDANAALACLRQDPFGGAAALVGVVAEGTSAQVLVRGPLGALRILDESNGAPLPRTC
jgi:hydrogenase expression/formation protein HypE